MLSDGKGNTSSMRVIILLIIGMVLASKFYNAWITKSPIVWDTQDFGLIAAALGSKLIQNTQEKDVTVVTPSQTVTK